MEGSVKMCVKLFLRDIMRREGGRATGSAQVGDGGRVMTQKGGAINPPRSPPLLICALVLKSDLPKSSSTAALTRTPPHFPHPHVRFMLYK